MKSSIGRSAGFQEYVVLPAKEDQNEVEGLQKWDRPLYVSSLWTVALPELENEIITMLSNIEKRDCNEEQVLHLPTFGQIPNKSRHS